MDMRAKRAVLVGRFGYRWSCLVLNPSSCERFTNGPVLNHAELAEAIRAAGLSFLVSTQRAKALALSFGALSLGLPT